MALSFSERFFKARIIFHFVQKLRIWLLSDRRSRGEERQFRPGIPRYPSLFDCARFKYPHLRLLNLTPLVQFVTNNRCRGGDN